LHGGCWKPALPWVPHSHEASNVSGQRAPIWYDLLAAAKLIKPALLSYR
jgi:hypothetical protein